MIISFRLFGTPLVGVLIVTAAFGGAVGFEQLRDINFPILTLPHRNMLKYADVVGAGTEFSLTVTKLKIQAPIIANVSGTDEQVYLAALEHGVAQLAGSANPDQSGNLFIFGHSSYYKNKYGDYKEVFKYLDQLKPADEITVGYHGKDYRFVVASSKVVADNDWSITHPSIDGAAKTLTLMTCWPPGTLQNRYVVIATQLTKS